MARSALPVVRRIYVLVHNALLGSLRQRRLHGCNEALESACRQRLNDRIQQRIIGPFDRHQLLVAVRKVKRPKLRAADRIVLIGLAALFASWRNALVSVQPARPTELVSAVRISLDEAQASLR
jgi:hypothetical protein